MCGLTGFLDSSASQSEADALATVRRMADTLVHRGPDDAGSWVDPSVGLALGFRRLAIIDLSPAGHQPMLSASGRLVIVFNGEVYNAPDLRTDLQAQGRAPHFRGHSDTEILLAAIEAWGLAAALARSIGMFAFALWDTHTRQLSLVRDRLGVKPLYYGWAGRTLLFGSELKALRAHPAFRAEIDRDALALLLRANCVPGPASIYRNIKKLPPGTVLTVEPAAPGQGELRAYWSAHRVAEAGVADPFPGTAEEAVAALETLLRDAVRLRMVADVPLGVFLSGGVDSAAVTALMQAQSGRPVRTFSIGFAEDDFDESRYARAVARHLGTAHTELVVTPAEAQAVIPRLPTLYDEPFADSSQIPTYLVAALARRHVTVSLSGDGGDELFGGYNRYVGGRRLWRAFGWLPRGVRRGLAGALRRLTPQRWDALARLLPRGLRPRQLGDKLAKLSDVLPADGIDAFHALLASHWHDPAAVVLGASRAALPQPPPSPRLPDETLHMMYLDLVGYLPDDILVKVDRASMGVSLEAREPLLDHRLVEFAWRLPRALKIRGGQGKWPLRQVLYRHVPRALIERPKSGFALPLGDWLRGPLRAWAEALLDEGRLKREGYFQAAPIRARWAEHLAGRHNWQYHLWDVLMFQAWLDAARLS